jgi:hypothetical protein
MRSVALLTTNKRWIFLLSPEMGPLLGGAPKVPLAYSSVHSGHGFALFLRVRAHYAFKECNGKGCKSKRMIAPANSSTQ